MASPRGHWVRDSFWIQKIVDCSDLPVTDMPRVMSLPGKHMEQLRLAPSQMLPRGQLKKPVRDILRDISRRSKATVDMRGGPGGSIIFEGKGTVDSVRQALREVAQQVGSKVRGLNIFTRKFELTNSSSLAIGSCPDPDFRARPHHWPPGYRRPGHSDSHWCSRPSPPRR